MKGARRANNPRTKLYKGGLTGDSPFFLKKIVFSLPKTHGIL